MNKQTPFLAVGIEPPPTIFQTLTGILIVSVLVIILNILSLHSVMGQESVNSLSINPSLIITVPAKTSKVKSLQKNNASLPLPFLDDFTGPSPYPNPKYWSDSDVYINSTFPLDPPSIGVATFDALNKWGRIYLDSVTTFQADKLTSVPIALDNTAKDVYLTFFYEPRGIGDNSGAPTPNDSLRLEFYAPDSLKWYRVWGNPKYTADTAFRFHPVTIPITDPKFLKDKFRFRFLNYITRRTSSDPGQLGNYGYWHIDYVHLDKNRVFPEAFNDIAINMPGKSLLKGYQSMPWAHFNIGYPSLISASVDVSIHNNGSSVSNQQASMKLRNILSATYDSTYSSGNANINPKTTSPYKIQFTNPFDIATPDGGNPDSEIFDVSYSILTDALDTNSLNNEVHFYQIFKNYFAYDDGSPERGYGFTGKGSSSAMLAMRFKSYIVNDTLTGISIYFNPTRKDTTSHYLFTLKVWSDNNEKPGTNVYTKATPDTVRYGSFPIYKLDVPQIINPGFFYIGMQQLNDNFLNMGLDLNNDNHQNLFLNFGTGWENSGIAGSLMIRPVFKKYNGAFLKTPDKKAGDIRIFPNPANDVIYFEGLKHENAVSCTVYSITGKPVLQQTIMAENMMDVSYLLPGIYIIKMTEGHQSYNTFKLMINR